jgi:hypothetical protein
MLATPYHDSSNPTLITITNLLSFLKYIGASRVTKRHAGGSEPPFE